MRAVATAADRQTRVVAGLKHSLQGAEGKEQNHQDREGTPHLN